MRLVSLATYDDVSRAAARHVARQLLSASDSAIAWPSGQTPIGLYRQLVQFHNAGLVSFAESVSFGLDEYQGLAPDHPQSFHRFLHDRLFDHVDLSPDRVFTLNGATSDPEAECDAFERAIAQHPLDLAILGIGPNGHVAFNEPGSDWDSRTREVRLDVATLANLRTAFAEDELPERGLTMGIRTIMHAAEIVLLASGPAKAVPLQRALTEPISPEVPASVLRLHPNATLYADREALAHVDPAAIPLTV